MNGNRPAADILANVHTVKPSATYLYGYADAEHSQTVGLHSGEQVREIVARVLAMHPNLTGEYTADGVTFRNAEGAVWTFQLA